MFANATIKGITIKERRRQDKRGEEERTEMTCLIPEGTSNLHH